jgi:hypothetical protein
MGKSYSTKNRERKTLTFTLDDREFQFNTPKNASLVLAAASDDERAPIREFMNWLSTGLGEEDNAYIISRLQDPADDLDFDLIQEIVEDLMAQAAGRPTKPQRV